MDPITPEPTTTSNSYMPPAPKKGFKFILPVIVTLTVIFLLTAGIFSAIAYEKLDIHNPGLQRNITNIVLGLPFTPKTARYLLEQATIAHSKVSQHSFNLSLAAKSEDFVSALGFEQLDLEAKGNVDYSDPKNLRMTIAGSVTKDFNFDIRKNDSVIFFKINKFPPVILAMLQLDAEKVTKLLENWIGYDTKPLDTEARRRLDDQNPQKSFTKEYVTNLVDDLLDEKLLSALSVSNDKIGTIPVYKLHLTANDKTVDALIDKMSDRASGKTSVDKDISYNRVKPSAYIKDLLLDLWVDQNSHYIRKVVTSFTFTPNYQSPSSGQIGASSSSSTQVLAATAPGTGALGKKEYPIVTVISFDDFGKAFNVETPADYLKPEEFVSKIMQASSGSKIPGDSEQSSSSVLSPVELTKRARDAARLTDLANLQQAINVVAQESVNPSGSILCNRDESTCGGNSMTGSRVSDGTGWLKINLSTQASISMPILPIDPVNNSIHHYTYCASNNGWEIDTVLESDQQKGKMLSDGGDDDTKYEIGSNLHLIDKVGRCKY